MKQWLQESVPNAGESMATKDGISVSSTDSNKASERSESTNNEPPQTDFDDDISSITLATDNKFSMLCKCDALNVGWDASMQSRAMRALNTHNAIND